VLIPRRQFKNAGAQIGDFGFDINIAARQHCFRVFGHELADCRDLSNYFVVLMDVAVGVNQHHFFDHIVLKMVKLAFILGLPVLLP